MKSRDVMLFFGGFNLCLLLTIISLKIAQHQLNHRVCFQCKKKYWLNKSTCKDYPALFCSEWCNKSKTMDQLLAHGVSPEIAVRLVAYAEKGQKEGNA